AGIVVEVRPDDLAPYRTEGMLAGIAFQRALEHAAFVAGGARLVAPAQRLVDFVEDRASSDLPRCSYRPGIRPVNLHELLPPAIGERRAAYGGDAGRRRGLNDFVAQSTIFFRTAKRTISAVLCRSSFSMVCLRCVSTVLTLTSSRVAISLFVLPSAMSCRTSRSRSVKSPRLSSACGSRPSPTYPSSSIFEIAGLKNDRPCPSVFTAFTRSRSSESFRR